MFVENCYVFLLNDIGFIVRIIYQLRREPTVVYVKNIYILFVKDIAKEKAFRKIGALFNNYKISEVC